MNFDVPLGPAGNSGYCVVIVSVGAEDGVGEAIGEVVLGVNNTLMSCPSH